MPEIGRACGAPIAARRAAAPPYKDGVGAPALRARAFLDDAPGVRDGDAVGDLRDDSQIMRDKQKRETESLRSRARSSRICFCTVTSSAVVGSSAISSRGSPCASRSFTEAGTTIDRSVRLAPAASAMAIIARCRKPPENWCGYCRARKRRLRHGGAFQRRDDATTYFLARETGSVRANRFRNLRANAHDGIERGHRLLKNHGDVAAALADPFAFGKRKQIQARSGRPFVPANQASPLTRATGAANPSPPAPAWISRCPIRPRGPVNHRARSQAKHRPPDESSLQAWEVRR